jgi:DNA-binding Xre family transcriptional regulator
MINVTINIRKLQAELSKRLLKMSYGDIAKKTGFSRQFISDLHKGKIQAQPRTYRAVRNLFKLCKILHINFNDIVRQENEEISY